MQEKWVLSYDLVCTEPISLAKGKEDTYIIFEFSDLKYSKIISLVYEQDDGDYIGHVSWLISTNQFSSQDYNKIQIRLRYNHDSKQLWFFEGCHQVKLAIVR